MKRTISQLASSALLLFSLSIGVFAQRTTALRGQVTDQLGAVVVGATVTATDAGGKRTTTQTDGNGAYRFDNLTPGSYNVSIQPQGFASQTVNGLQLSSGANTRDFQLSVTIEEQRVTVDDMRGVSTDPNSNKTARVM